VKIVNIFLSLVIVIMVIYAVLIKPNRSSIAAELLRQKVTAVFQEEEENQSYASQETTAFVSVVVVNLGVTKENFAYKLPTEVSLAFSAHASTQEVDNPEIAEHNILMQLPLEEEEDHSPDLLSLKYDAEDNLNKLELFLNKFQHRKLMYSSNLELYSKTENTIMDLLSILSQKDIIYLCGKINQNDLVYQVAKKMNFPILANDFILDEYVSFYSIESKLLELETLAKERGYAVAIINDSPIAADVLQKWIITLPEKNIKLVPLTELYKIKQESNYEFRG
jgi:uncharacterized protein